MAARRTARAIARQAVRNPLVSLARKRTAGPHGPSRKAERSAAKVRLRKQLKDD